MLGKRRVGTARAARIDQIATSPEAKQYVSAGRRKS